MKKIKGAEISLGPEMKSTGEVLGISTDYDEAIYKAFIGSGINLPKKKNIICTIKDSAKDEFYQLQNNIICLVMIYMQPKELIIS